MANCSESGRLIPSSSRTRSTTWPGARSPTMASTGSIGTTRPMMKVTNSSPRKVRSSETTRLRAVRSGDGRDRLLKPAPAVDRLSAGVVTTNRALRQRLLLRHFRIEVVIEGGADDEALGVGAHRRHLDLLEHDDEGRRGLVDLQIGRAHV